MKPERNPRSRYFVISHSHWDREWYLNYQQFRLKLVRLIDNLFTILEHHPAYRFHLDAQTVVIEDYLEIRPFRRDLFREYVREGRILIGPWYVQNDFYLTSGESTIRNLQIGIDVAEAYGGTTRVGYAPDQFGLISQLPQLLQGFSITELIFGRGYTFWIGDDTSQGLEDRDILFNWRSPEGSSVIASHMAQWYNNAQRLVADPTRSRKMLDRIRDGLGKRSPVSPLLCMNGVDHLEAQDDLMPVLEAIRSRLGEEESIQQATMPEYFAAVRQELTESGRRLDVWTGELRNGTEYEILTNTASSRVYLKQENQALQDRLEHSLEPLCSYYLGLALPERYPADELYYAWKRLIVNHAHDSICGCSHDEIHRHMENRFEELNEHLDYLQQETVEELCSRIDRSELSRQDYLVTVFNTTASSRDGVVSVEIHIPLEDTPASFALLTDEGEQVPVTVTREQLVDRPLLSAVNLPGGMRVVSLTFEFHVADVPGFGHQSYHLTPCRQRPGSIQIPDSPSIHGTPLVKEEEPAVGGLRLENELIAAEIAPNGSITLEDIATGRRWGEVLELLDEEDAGDSYVHRYAEKEQIRSTGHLDSVRMVRRDELCRRAELIFSLPVPVDFDLETGRRSRERSEQRIELLLELRRGERWLRCTTRFDNRVRDHRVRAVVRSGATSPLTIASIPFDVVTRDVTAVRPKVRKGDHPFSGMAAHGDESGGMTVLTKGLYEYEHLSEEPGALALTLMRGNGFIFKFSDDPEAPNPLWRVPENQCLRPVEVEFALMPATGTIGPTESLWALEQYRTPLLPHFHAVDLRRFSGGRPGVQDTEVKEIFYQEPYHPERVLPQSGGLLQVEGKVLVSAVKRARRGTDMLLRLYSVEEKKVTARIDTAAALLAAFETDLEEEPTRPLPLSRGGLNVEIAPRQILTLRLQLDPGNPWG